MVFEVWVLYYNRSKSREDIKLALLGVCHPGIALCACAARLEWASPKMGFSKPGPGCCPGVAGTKVLGRRGFATSLEADGRCGRVSGGRFLGVAPWGLLRAADE